MICEWGDVVIAPFPFTDIPVAKKRPALVLSVVDFNRKNEHSMLAMITTAARSRWASDSPVTDLAAAGLPRSCVVRWKVFTLPNVLIQKRIGALAAADRTVISAMCSRILAPSDGSRRQAAPSPGE